MAAGRLEELRLDAEELRVEATLRAGRFRDVLADTQARVTEQPWREHHWTLLASAQYQAGCEGDALCTLRSSSMSPPGLSHDRAPAPVTARSPAPLTLS